MKQKKSTSKSTPRTNPKPTTGKTADDVAALIREGLTSSGAMAIADLANEDVQSHVIDWVSTQSLAIDGALLTPGIPCGRITECYGKNHAGKSTLLAHLFAEVQRRGGLAYCLDQEASLDRGYLTRIGVNVRQLQVLQPKQPTIEAGVEAMEKLIDQLTQYPDMLALIGWDTVAAAPALKELEEEFSKQQPGHAAKAIRAMCRRITARLAHTRIAFVVLNQSYTAIGKLFGDPETPYGGDALGFYSSVRLHMRAGAKLPDDVPGSMSRVRVVKSKVSIATGRTVEVAIARGNGFDNVYTIYTALVERKMISFGGGWCTVRLSETDELKWRGGWQGLVSRCAAEPETYARLADAYRALVAPAAPGAAEVPGAV